MVLLSAECEPRGRTHTDMGQTTGSGVEVPGYVGVQSPARRIGEPV